MLKVLYLQDDLAKDDDATTRDGFAKATMQRLKGSILLPADNVKPIDEALLIIPPGIQNYKIYGRCIGGLAAADSKNTKTKGEAQLTFKFI